MTYETVFLNILKSSLWGTAIAVPQEFDEWGKVFALAKAQSVLGLVANAVLSDAEVARRIPADMQKRLKAFVMSNMATHSMLNNTLVRVFSLLDEAGVRSVLLKGQGLAKNYPVPELRQCGDIDVYVGEENYAEACGQIDKIATKILPADVRQTVKHYEVIIGKITVEIHRYTDVNASDHYNAIYQKYSDEGMSSDLRVLNVAGMNVNTPEDTFNSFYIFNHLWHHFLTSGVGLRQFIDWMLFIHKHGSMIDQSRLRSILEDMDLMGPWKAFGCVLVDELGLPSSEFPFYDAEAGRKKTRILKRVLQEGNFGKERAYYGDRRGESYFIGKFKSLWYHFIRFVGLYIMFPSHAFRQFVYMAFVGFKAVWKDKFAKK